MGTGVASHKAVIYLQNNEKKRDSEGRWYMGERTEIQSKNGREKERTDKGEAEKLYLVANLFKCRM